MIGKWNSIKVLIMFFSLCPRPESERTKSNSRQEWQSGSLSLVTVVFRLSLPAWYGGCSGVILVAEPCQLSDQNCTKDWILKKEKSGCSSSFFYFHFVHIDTYYWSISIDTYFIDTYFIFHISLIHISLIHITGIFHSCILIHITGILIHFTGL